MSNLLGLFKVFLVGHTSDLYGIGCCLPQLSSPSVSLPRLTTQLREASG